MPDYLTVEETAEVLGYSIEYVRRMLRNGKLSADKKAGIWLVYRDAVEAYKEGIAGKAKNDPTRGL
jgi:excisionase family DNA binding protein